MVTSSKSQQGEGILEKINPDIGKQWFIHSSTMTESNVGENTKTKMSDEQFQQAFLIM